jgi:hypothetical protein
MELSTGFTLDTGEAEEEGGMRRGDVVGTSHCPSGTAAI